MADPVLQDQLIGPGENYTTITTWEAALPDPITGGPWYGRCLAADFSENVTINIGTAASNYVVLTSAPGARHKGASQSVTGFPAARIIGQSGSTTLRLESDFGALRDLEISKAGGPAAGIYYGVYIGLQTDPVALWNVHGCLVWNGGYNTNTSNHGILVSDINVQALVRRCSVHGMGGAGIYFFAVRAGSAVQWCTAAYNYPTWWTQFWKRAVGAYFAIQGCLGAGGSAPSDNFSGRWTQTDNGSTDATSDLLTNLVAADELRNPDTSSNFANFDARLKPTAQCRLAAGAGTYDGIQDIDIEAQVLRAGLASWDIGSDHVMLPASRRYFLKGEANVFYIQRGSKSKTIPVTLESEATPGDGLTGITNSDVTCYYKRQGDAASTAVTLAAGTLGSWVSGGFKEVDATNLPGVYEVGLPDAAIASGADWVVLSFVLATANEVPPVLVVLTDRDPHGQSKYDHRQNPTE